MELEGKEFEKFIKYIKRKRIYKEKKLYKEADDFYNKKT